MGRFSLFIHFLSRRKIENMQGAIAETRVEEKRQRVLDVAEEIVDRFICKEMVDAMPAPIRFAPLPS